MPHRSARHWHPARLFSERETRNRLRKQRHALGPRSLWRTAEEQQENTRRTLREQQSLKALVFQVLSSKKAKKIASNRHVVDFR